MNNSQLSSYVAKVSNSDQAKLTESVRKTLSSQSDLFDGSLANLTSLTPLEDLQGLLDIWSESVNDPTSLDVSILAEASKISASISAAGKAVASVSETIRRISVDWNSCDRSQLAFDAPQIEIPLIIELETRHSVGDISLVSYQTVNFVLSGDKVAISEAMAVIEGKGLTPEKISLTDAQCISTRINPQQDVKLDLQYCILTLKGVEISFKENSLQMDILRVMFGKQGKNRVKLELVDLYEAYAKEQNWDVEKKYRKNNKKLSKKQNWDWFDDKNVVGIEKAKFIKQIRNATTAINNKVRKVIGCTEDFLEIRNNVCRINPKLLKS